MSAVLEALLGGASAGRGTRETLLARQVARGASPARRELLGLAGPPGSGKSTLAAALADELTADGVAAVVLPMDGFHLAQARLVELGRRGRMGAPDTFDVAGFARVLAELRAASGVVRAPLFDRTVEEPVPDALEIPPAVRVVIAEGNYLLHDADGWERIRPLLDRVGYLAVDDDLRRARLVARHVAHGKSADAAAAWVREVDEPNAELIARGAARADAILPGS